MAFTLTRAARIKSQEGAKEPILVLEIDGIGTIYSSSSIAEFIRIGDTDLFIDGTWRIGGVRALENQGTLISFGDNAGTTTKISQNLDAEKGRGSTVSSMTIGLIDKNEEITRLITPNEVVEDVLGRRCRVYLGFSGTAYRADYIPVFKGIIDDLDSGAGFVRITLSNTEQKKRGEIFQKSQTKLNGAINNSQTTITVDSTTNFLLRQTRPDGNPETEFTPYIRIDDEIIEYSNKNATQFLGCVRGSLGTVANSHSDDTTVDSFYRLGPGNGIDLALKVMLSGHGGLFETGVAVKSFNYISPTLTVANSIFFEDVDVKEVYGLTIGDYVTTTASAEGANNVSLKKILDIQIIDEGSYIVVDAVTFVTEVTTIGTIGFRSKYDSLGAGAGLKMIPDDVDVEQHELLKTRFFASYSLDVYLDDTITGKDFIEKELYLPGAMFSVPRKARSSVQNTVGPIPSSSIVTLDSTNVVNPQKLKIRRSLGKNFYNNVVYKYDQEAVENKFLSSTVTVAADSLSRIPVGNRTLTIESKGLRTSLSAQNIVSQSSNRRLKRYKFGAEYIESIEVLYGVGYNIEIGDVLIVDGTELAIADTKNAKRGMEPRFFEVINKTLDIKTGRITLNLIDTASDVQNRYGLVGPSSRIKSATSTTVFTIEWNGYFSFFDSQEFKKWNRYRNAAVLVYNTDRTIQDNSVILSVDGFKITLASPLSFTPTAGMYMSLDEYDNQPDSIKLLYAFMRNSGTFNDGGSLYLMI